MNEFPKWGYKLPAGELPPGAQTLVVNEREIWGKIFDAQLPPDWSESPINFEAQPKARAPRSADAIQQVFQAAAAVVMPEVEPEREHFKASTLPDIPLEAEMTAEEEEADLIRQAVALGIKIDKRWGVRKLRRVIQEYEDHGDDYS